jgi:uncharacterized membrane protein YfcA
MNDILPFVLLGLAAGVLSGLLGIGGAVIIIPSLVYLFGFPQHRAEGTTLALMVPPIGILAVIPFFKRDCVDVRAAGYICLGFLVGGLMGGRLAMNLSGPVLQKAFGVLLLGLAARMLFWAK